MDENLARWIEISIAKHFEAIATGLSLPYLVDGVDERDDEQWEDHVEQRITGPQYRDLGSKYEVVIGINFLFTALMDMAGADSYRLNRWTGKFAEEMIEPIPVYKYGTDPGDDQSYIGCFMLKNTKANGVNVYPFGQLDKDHRVRQSEVDAVYYMEYKP